MKNYIAIHTFKSEELRTTYLETIAQMEPSDVVAAVTGQRSADELDGRGWNEQRSLLWKAESDAIIEQLGDE